MGSPVYNLEKIGELQEKYLAQYGEDFLDWLYIATAYDAAMVLFEAIEEVGTDSKAIKQYLDDLEGFNGYSGLNAFDEEGDVAEGVYALFRAENGKKVMIS